MKRLALLTAVALPLSAVAALPVAAQQQTLVIEESTVWTPGATRDEGAYAMMVQKPEERRARNVLVREESSRWAPGFTYEDGSYVRYRLEQRIPVDSTDVRFK